MQNKIWRRIFVPEYFCYEVVDSIKSTGIEVVFYPDYPLANDQALLKSIKFSDSDVLLRMNYFGWRTPRDNSELRVTVIEDHSHNMFSDWALQSNADWRVASMRKTLPIPDGGILWSNNKHMSLLKIPLLTEEHAKLSDDRYRAMEMKSMYLNSKYKGDKKDYLSLLNKTEKVLGSNHISAISTISEKKIQEIPFSIMQKRILNFISLKRFLSPNKCEILHGNFQDSPFSLILLFVRIPLKADSHSGAWRTLFPIKNFS